MLARHPKNVYLPEQAVLDLLDEWIAWLFAPENLDETVDQLLASSGVAKSRRRGIGANEAQAELEAAEAERALQPEAKGVMPVMAVFTAFAGMDRSCGRCGYCGGMAIATHG